jgi:hypothetical protein
MTSRFDSDKYIHLFQPKIICGRNLYVRNDQIYEKINVLNLKREDVIIDDSLHYSVQSIEVGSSPERIVVDCKGITFTVSSTTEVLRVLSRIEQHIMEMNENIMIRMQKIEDRIDSIEKRSLTSMDSFEELMDMFVRSKMN